MKLLAVTIALAIGTMYVAAKDGPGKPEFPGADQFSPDYDAGDPRIDPDFVLDYCRACLERRNQNDYYYDPFNCERFYHCFVDENGAVGGIARKCPPGERFSRKINSCVKRHDGRADDPICDVDECENTQTMFEGTWYDPTINCGIYFTCSNFHSIRRCCRPGQSYDLANRECVTDVNCDDHIPECTEQSETVLDDAIDVTDTECTDANYDVRRRINPNAPYRYFVLLGEDAVPMLCGRGTGFSLITCRCSDSFDWTNADLSEFNGHPLLLDIKFNDANKIFDSSVHRMWVDNSNQIGSENNDAGNLGVGQFAEEKWLEVPAFQGIDLRSNTIDFWYNSECSAQGDIQTLFSQGDSDLTQFPDAITIVVYLDQTEANAQTLNYAVRSPNFPGGEQTLTQMPALTCGQWHHIAIVTDVIDQNQVTVYHNCAEEETVDLAGQELLLLETRLQKCPLTIGKSNTYPFFTGKLDEFRVSRGALPKDDICAQITATDPNP